MSRIFSLSPQNRAGYDVPLHLKLGTEFLVLLIGLMTFLSLLAAIGALVLGHLANKWTSGLENSITIEIPAANFSEEATRDLLSALQKVDGVLGASQMEKKDMGALLSPWLGKNSSLWEDLPVPILITLSLSERTDKNTRAVQDLTRKIAPDARVDAHEDWLADLLKLANGLRMTSFVVLILILCVTAIVIAGAVRSRMAIHHRELELLHIMGANDRYITNQFIRYILMQSIKGTSGGAALGAILLLAFEIMSRKNPGTLPELSLIGWEWLIFIIIPAILMVIGMAAARYTSLRILREMP